MRQILLVLFMSSLVALAVSYFNPIHKTANSLKTVSETPLEHIKKTKTLRCGYIVWPPEFNKDPNTGEFSGLSYDIITEATKRLGWKIDWVEEVNFGTMASSLEANHFDAICFTLYRDTPRALFSRLTVPLFYSGTGIYVRADDTRFDRPDITAMNNDQYTIATMDGEMSAITATQAFPKAKQVTLPQNSSAADLLLNVATGKADMTLVNTLSGARFIKNNPDKVKNVTIDQPLTLFSHGFAFRQDQQDVVETMNVVIQEMHDQGIIDQILDKYTLGSGSYYRVAKSYR